MMQRHDGTMAARSGLARLYKSGGRISAISALAAFLVPWSLIAAPTTLPASYGGEGFVYPEGIPANRTTPRTAQMLGDALKRSQTIPEQAHYLHELGLTRLPQAAPFVAPFLDDANPLLRAAAAEAAGYIGDASLSDALHKLLGDTDARVRRAALSASVRATRDLPEKAKWVGQMLSDPAETVVIEAMRLAQPSNADAIAALLPKAGGSVQVQAITTLARLNATGHAAAIVPFLKSDDLALKAAAITAMGDLRVADQTQTILGLLEDRHPTVRRLATRAMMHLASPSVQQDRALALVKNDPDPSVREAACAIFAVHPLPAAVDPLVRQLYSPYLPLHDAARNALSHTASADMTGQIIAQAVKLLQEKDIRRKEDGSYLLGHYQSDAALEDHLKLIADYPKSVDGPVDWALYTQAVESLGRIGTPKAGAPLVPLLKKAPTTMGEMMNSTVSTDAEAAACVTVGQIKFTSALPQIWRIINGDGMAEPENMRAAAVWALSVLEPTDDAKTNDTLMQIVSGMDTNPGPARYEACKALVHRNVTQAVDVLKQAATTDTDPQARFAAHWAYEHLSGQTLAYTPPDLPWTAETTLIDMTQK